MAQFNEEAPAAGTGFGSVTRDDGMTFLTPGIHTVTIKKVELVTPQTGKPYIGVTLASDKGATIQRFYVSPGAKEQSLINMVHLFNKAASDADINGLTWPDGDWAAMAAAVSKLVCTGQAIEIKLSGEEYKGKINAKFAFRPFAQRVGEDKLVYSEAMDTKREEVANMTSAIPQAPSVGDMPAAPVIPQ
jgi:hypothetical protein